MLASKSASSCSFVCARPSWCIALLIDTSDVRVRVRVVQAECAVERLVWRDVRGDVFALVVEAARENEGGGEGDSEASPSCRLRMLPSPPRPEDVTYVQGSRTEGRVGRRERETSSVNFVQRERERG